MKGIRFSLVSCPLPLTGLLYFRSQSRRYAVFRLGKPFFGGHPQAVIQLHTGTALASLTRPSMGAWLMYGLGTENQDLPGYISINPPPSFGGAGNYGSAFLPAYYQGMKINDVGYVPNLQAKTDLKLQRRQIDLLQSMNRDLAASSSAPDHLNGVIESYELAFRMQSKVPDLLDLSSEPQHVRDAYGVKDGPAGSFARQCLMARRLSEAGVRFVEICHPGWDQHNNLHKDLIKNSAAVDQPTAALLADLDQRGLLDETLVLFGSEFGRLPTSQGVDGRDHNITGYPMWLAGGGVKAGYSHGATDEFGRHAVEGRMHTMDLHATLLALMGLDHERLTSGSPTTTPVATSVSPTSAAMWRERSLPKSSRDSVVRVRRRDDSWRWVDIAWPGSLS